MSGDKKSFQKCHLSYSYLSSRLRQSLNEALVQEDLIGEKMETAQALLGAIRASLQQSWTSMISEDDLLTKIEQMEGDLVAKVGDKGAKNVQER